MLLRLGTRLRAALPVDELAAQHNLIDRLRDWLSTHGFDIRRNNGNQNNCLIISMLQHATGDYHSQHAAQAKHYKKLLVERSGGEVKTSNTLFSDDALTDWRIAGIVDMAGHYDAFTARTPR